MKKLVIATLLLGSATLAHAGSPTLINSDGSDLSALCIASTQTTLREAAAQHGIPSAELRDISCNGLALAQFARQYRDGGYDGASKANVVASLEPAGYLLRKKDESPLTALCVAAAVSEQEYSRVKATYFSDEADIEAEVLCNGVPLRSFARKFRESDVRLVSQR